MLNNFIKKLNEPFPDKTSYLENIYEITGVGIFVTMFLYIVSPTEIGTYPGNVFLLCCAFGVLTVLISFAYDFFLLKILKLEKDLPTWTFKKWIFSVIGLITCIAIGNYLLILYVSNGLFFSPNMFFQIILVTWMIGIIPIFFSGLMTQLRAYKANQIHAANISTTLPIPTLIAKQISIISLNEKNQINLNQSDLLFVEAMQNYVSIYFLKEEKIQKEILRTTLSNVEKQLKDTSIIRCHRSYLVNPNQIQK